MADGTGQYSEESFWDKIRGFAAFAGREIVEKALTLFYASQRPETPLWAKAVIYSALAYFILPADAVPDFIPFTGYADDLGTIAAALGAIATCITPEIQAQAKGQADQWFSMGQPEATDQPSPQNGDTIREIAID